MALPGGYSYYLGPNHHPSSSSFSVDRRAAAGGLGDPPARAARAEGGAAVQLRPGGRQPVLGQVVLQPEGVLQVHPLRQPQGHHLQPSPGGQRQCEQLLHLLQCTTLLSKCILPWGLSCTLLFI